MFTGALIFAFVCAIFEISITRQLMDVRFGVGWLVRKCQGIPIVTLTFSLLLSVAIGSLFHAAGAVLAISGVISTLMVQPVYWAIAKRERYQQVASEYWMTYRPVFMAFRWTFKWAFCWIWGPVYLNKRWFS